MTHDEIKALLNMQAVMSNFERLVALDPVSMDMAKDWNVTIQFSILGGPSFHVGFNSGICSVGEGKHQSPSVKLIFVSSKHFNAMMDNASNPIPVKGFLHLKFLSTEFPKLSERLEHFLKPDQTKLEDPEYLKINTCLTLNTAFRAVKLLALHDPVGKLCGAHIPDGTLQFEVLPDGPFMAMEFAGKEITVLSEPCQRPSAVMQFKNADVANALLNGNVDAFAALAAGDVAIRGKIPIIESVNLILDRIPVYLA